VAGVRAHGGVREQPVHYGDSALNLVGWQGRPWRRDLTRGSEADSPLRSSAEAGSARGSLAAGPVREGDAPAVQAKPAGGCPLDGGVRPHAALDETLPRDWLADRTTAKATSRR